MLTINVNIIFFLCAVLNWCDCRVDKQCVLLYRLISCSKSESKSSLVLNAILLMLLFVKNIYFNPTHHIVHYGNHFCAIYLCVVYDTIGFILVWMEFILTIRWQSTDIICQQHNLTTTTGKSFRYAVIQFDWMKRIYVCDSCIV